jgi:hypothetical protein
MADTSDSIPANAIRLSDAFERLFNAKCPDAAKLTATMNRLNETALNLMVTAEANEPAHQKFWDKWDAAHRKTEPVLLDALRCGELTAYRFDPRTGKDRDIPVKDWEADLTGDDLEYLPAYLLKSKFDEWLRGIQGEKQKRTKGSPKLDLAKQALKEKYGDAPLHNKSVKILHGVVNDYCIKHNEQTPSQRVILRARDESGK